MHVGIEPTPDICNCDTMHMEKISCFSYGPMLYLGNGPSSLRDNSSLETTLLLSSDDSSLFPINSSGSCPTCSCSSGGFIMGTVSTTTATVVFCATEKLKNDDSDWNAYISCYTSMNSVNCREFKSHDVFVKCQNFHY